MPRRHRTVQSYSPGGANVIPYLWHTPIGIRTVPVLPLLSRVEYIDRRTCLGSWPLRRFLGQPESTTQTETRSVQPFLHSSHHWVPIL